MMKKQSDRKQWEHPTVTEFDIAERTQLGSGLRLDGELGDFDAGGGDGGGGGGGGGGGIS
jgi:hypothetical protein